jgi:hypothetical protein
MLMLSTCLPAVCSLRLSVCLLLLPFDVCMCVSVSPVHPQRWNQCWRPMLLPYRDNQQVLTHSRGHQQPQQPHLLHPHHPVAEAVVR